MKEVKEGMVGMVEEEKVVKVVVEEGVKEETGVKDQR